MTPIQALVAKHYFGGEYDHISDPKEDVGDTLFNFMMAEAHDADTLPEFDRMLDNAVEQLRQLQSRVYDEIISDRATP